MKTLERAVMMWNYEILDAGVEKKNQPLPLRPTYQSSALLLLGGASGQGIDIAIVLIEFPALISGHWNNNFHNKQD